MTCILAERLGAYNELTTEEAEALAKVSVCQHVVKSRRDFILEGDVPAYVHLVTGGLACRHKILKNGRKQIVGFLVPGDFCDLNVLLLRKMDYAIAAISPVSVVRLPRAEMLELLRFPGIARAMWLATLVDEAVLRGWVANVGGRSAERRLAHLFCEMHLRLTAVGLSDTLEYDLPLTQGDLGHALGISSVHVNRSLQSLKEIVIFKGKRITIKDMSRLKKLAGFCEDYLHLSIRRVERRAA